MCLQIVFLHSSIHSCMQSGDGGSAIGCVIDKKIPANAYLGYEIPGEYPVTEIIQELKRNCMVGVAKGRAEFGHESIRQ